MPGYVVNTRIERVRPQFVALAGEPRRAQPHAVPRDLAETIDLSGRPFGERLSEQYIRLRESWSQMVFFLLDPESWR